LGISAELLNFTLSLDLDRLIEEGSGRVGDVDERDGDFVELDEERLWSSSFPCETFTFVVLVLEVDLEALGIDFLRVGSASEGLRVEGPCVFDRFGVPSGFVFDFSFSGVLGPSFFSLAAFFLIVDVISSLISSAIAPVSVVISQS